MPIDLHRTATAGLVLIGLALLSSGTASAQIVGGWGPRQFCTSYLGDPAPTCAYSTWEQCLETIRGLGLTCEVNPYYRGPTAPVRGRKQHRS